MERLRYVARSGDVDPAIIVSETVEAIRGLSPGPAELVSLCRNLVDRHVTCGPLWWLCAHLLADAEALERAWTLAGEIDDDPTADRLAAALPDDCTVLTIGYPALAAQALARRGDVMVLAVEAGFRTNALIRMLDRNDVESQTVPAEAALAAMAQADLVLVEAEATSTHDAICSMGSGLVVNAATATGTPAWLVAGRGRRLPGAFVDAISRRVTCGVRPWESEFERVPTDEITNVAGPPGVRRLAADRLLAECAPVPELVSPSPG